MHSQNVDHHDDDVKICDDEDDDYGNNDEAEATLNTENEQRNGWMKMMIM